MKDKKFIVTKDEYTADKLLSCGFQLINNASGVYTFLNVIPKNFSFAEIENGKCSYTDILCL